MAMGAKIETIRQFQKELKTIETIKTVVKITAVAKALPQFTRETKEILPFVEAWLEGQDSRFKRKVLKIFEGAGVDRRYAIMDAHEVFLNTSFEERNDIYVREMKNLGKQAFQKALLKSIPSSANRSKLGVLKILDKKPSYALIAGTA